MKSLWVGDPHFTPRVPSGRIDDFLQTVTNKYMQVVAVANEHKVNMVGFLGDMFHHKGQHDNPVYFLNYLKSLLFLIEADKYGIVGNHDILYDRIETLHTMPLNNLFLSHALRHLKINSWLINDQGHYAPPPEEPRVAMVGFDWGVPSQQIQEYQFSHYAPQDVRVACIHAFISGLPSSVPDFYHKTDIIHNVNALLESPFDVFFVGHDHRYFYEKIPYKGKDKHFISVGSLVRMSSHESTKKRIPCVVMMDVKSRDDITFEKYPLHIRPPEEVFTSAKALKKKVEGSVEDFVSSLRLKAMNTSEPHTILDGLEDELKEFLRGYLERAGVI